MKIKKGFTLIELLIVMAIIMILAAILFVRFSTAQKKARDATRKADLKEIQNALEMYADDHKGAVPVRTQLGPPVEVSDLTELSPTYISRMPSDPKNNDDFKYFYYSPGKQYWLRAKLEAQKTADAEIDVGGKTWDNACGSPYATCIIKQGSDYFFRLGNG